MNPAIRLRVASLAFVGACARCTPEVDAPDAAPAPRVCERHCAHRFAVGCLEPALAAHCEEVCELRVRQGYDAECAAHATREGMTACNVRCLPS